MRTSSIIEIQTYDYNGPVYNLEVEPNHETEDDQYYIEANTGIVVHNCHPRDNIALRSFAEKHDFGYDLFDAIMKAREEQAHNMAKFFEKIGVPKTMPVVVLGAGFKPGLNQLEGSPSILVGSYLEKLGYSVTYDREQFAKEVRGSVSTYSGQPSAYLLGWPEHFNDHLFLSGSYVIDPWRMCPPKNGVNVYHYGDTRKNLSGLQKMC